MQEAELTRAQQKVLHATIKKVTDDIETLSFNTAISQMMIFVNAFTNVEIVPTYAMRTFAGSAESVRAASELGALATDWSTGRNYRPAMA